MISERIVFDNVKEITVKTPQNEFFSFLTLGATFTKWMLKDGTNIIASYADYHQYSHPGMYLGTTIGPVTGRIENSAFTLKGKNYQIKDIHPHFLHGGKQGFSFVQFDLVDFRQTEDTFFLSFHTEYQHSILPGLMDVYVNYTLKSGAVMIQYLANTTATTLLNMTNHAYYNLDGDFCHSLDQHTLQVEADQVVLVNEDIIGRQMIPVAGTLFDFRQEKAIMPSVLDPSLKQQAANGLDHYFPLRKERSYDVKLHSKLSGRTLTLSSTYPGITVYTTNYPDQNAIQTGLPLALHSAICLEPSYHMNAINDSRFENFILENDQTYNHTIHLKLEE